MCVCSFTCGDDESYPSSFCYVTPHLEEGFQDSAVKSPKPTTLQPAEGPLRLPPPGLAFWGGRGYRMTNLPGLPGSLLVLTESPVFQELHPHPLCPRSSGTAGHPHRLSALLFLASGVDITPGSWVRPWPSCSSRKSRRFRALESGDRFGAQ